MSSSGGDGGGGGCGIFPSQIGIRDLVKSFIFSAKLQ